MSNYHNECKNGDIQTSEWKIAHTSMQNKNNCCYPSIKNNFRQDRLNIQHWNVLFENVAAIYSKTAFKISALKKRTKLFFVPS